MSENNPNPLPPHIANLAEAYRSDPVTSAFEEGHADGSIWITLPYSSFGRWIQEDDYLDEGDVALPIGRLHNISTLGFLVDSRYQIALQYFLPFYHTRADHSLTVAVTMKAILEQNEMSEHVIRTGAIAGLIHDQATPAGGDAVKSLDTDNLHEENYWKEVLDDKGRAFLQKYGVDMDGMDQIIHNNGILGEVLDIADRVTYVMKDLKALGVRPTSELDQVLKERNKVLNDLLEEDPLVGNIYQTVRIDKETGQVYFTDPDKLRVFLKLRAHLHTFVYLNPESQARDMMVAELLRPYYSPTPEEGKLDPHLLRRMTDDGLLKFLNEKYEASECQAFSHYGNPLAFMITNWQPDYIETFTTMQEAEKRKKIVEQDSSLFVLGTKSIRRFNAGTEYGVLDSNGKIVSFRDYDPETSRELDLIADSAGITYLFYSRDSDDIPHPHKN